MNSLFWQWYSEVASPRLVHRDVSFRKIFSYLDSIARDRPVTIVETGCVRALDNWAGDGQSTLLIDRYIEGAVSGSKAYSIDIDPIATALCREIVSKRIDVRTGDSILLLKQLCDELKRNGDVIDLLYLDSFDVDFANVAPSAVHHLKELVSVVSALHPETLLVVDDAPSDCLGVLLENNQIAIVSPPTIGGKAKFVAEYASQVGARILFSHYQVGWIGLV